MSQFELASCVMSALGQEKCALESPGSEGHCPVCLEECALEITLCGHSFCTACTTAWASIGSNCPLCRTERAFTAVNRGGELAAEAVVAKSASTLEVVEVVAHRAAAYAAAEVMPQEMLRMLAEERAANRRVVVAANTEERMLEEAEAGRRAELANVYASTRDVEDTRKREAKQAQAVRRTGAKDAEEMRRRESAKTRQSQLEEIRDRRLVYAARKEAGRELEAERRKEVKDIEVVRMRELVKARRMVHEKHPGQS